MVMRVIATTVLILAVGLVVASGEGLRAPSLATGFTGAQIFGTWGSPMPMHKGKCYRYMVKVHNSLTRLYASKACKGEHSKCKRRIQYRCLRLNKFLRKNFKSCPETKHMESEDKYLKRNYWFSLHPHCKGVGLAGPP